MEKYIATVDETRNILTKYHLNPKERYGQNFLVSPKIPSLVSNNDLINEDSLIIEIGPGLGALTQFLAMKAKKVICYEIDTALCDVLRQNFEDCKNVEILNRDFLKVELESIDTKNFKNVVIVSNLPYYITSNILCKIFLSKFKCDCIAMMQKEVAHRILNKEDINELVLYSHMLNDVEKLTEVSKNDFFPKPKVDSTVLIFKQKPLDTVLIKQIVASLFGNRRKTIYNNLKTLNGKELHEKFVNYILNECKISMKNRIDDFSIEEMISIVLKIRDIIYIKACSKVNIGLNIKNKKEDLHEFESVFYPFEELSDFIEFYILKSRRISVEFSEKTIDQKNNTIFKSISHLFENFDQEFGVDVFVYKKIPLGSGLGGGSSDCGTVLRSISKVFNINKDILIEAALCGGTDCVYFLNPVPSIIKDFRTYIPISLPAFNIKLVQPQLEISTKAVFDKFDELNPLIISDSSIYKEKIEINMLKNDLEESILTLYPPLFDVLSSLREENYDYVEFSGSGPTIVCIKDLTKS